MIHQPRRIGFWLRAAATAIDLVLMIPIYVLLVYLTYEVWQVDDERAYDFLWSALIVFWLSLEVLFVATVGKLILGLCIANADGTPAQPAARFNRWITKTWCFWLAAAAMLMAHQGLQMFASISFWALLIGCLAAANDYRQTWHDELAHTAVFRRRDVYGTQSDARRCGAIPPPLPPTST